MYGIELIKPEPARRLPVVLNAHSVDAEFVIAGQGEAEVDLRRRAARLRIADRLTFAARCFVGPRFWTVLDIFCPSRKEASALTGETDPAKMVAAFRKQMPRGLIAIKLDAEGCYLDDGHNQVRISGLAEIVQERPLLQEIWDANPLMRQYLGSLDNPQLIVYRIVPKQVRYMQEWALEYYDVPVEKP